MEKQTYKNSLKTIKRKSHGGNILPEMKAYHSASLNWNRVVQACKDREQTNQRIRRRPGYLGNLLSDMCPLKFRVQTCSQQGILAICKKIMVDVDLTYSMCKNRLQMDLRCKRKYLNHKSTRRKHRQFLCTLGIERTYLSVITFWTHFVIVVALLFFLCLAKQFRLLSDLSSITAFPVLRPEAWATYLAF